MSWQGYVDDSLLGSGELSEAAIIGVDNGGIWAASKGFPGEAQALIKGFQDSSAVLRSGVSVNGTKYHTIQASDKEIIAKQTTSGVLAVKTKKTVIVALWSKDGGQAHAYSLVHKLADQLIAADY
ncbi:unnamed protein product [Penicillium bialowiezense]